jgi:hypothetical protein
MAAGEGKRMRSEIPKVLHLFNGVPMLVKIIRIALEMGPRKIIVIVGNHHELIKKIVSEYISDISSIQYVRQVKQEGTGNAIWYCLPHYLPEDRILILNGDMPLITKDLISRFISDSDAGAKILVAKFKEPQGYGRILYDESGCILGIVEEKDCIESQKNIDIINAGIYLFDYDSLIQYIPRLDNNNAQKEYYLTDMVKLLRCYAEKKIQGFLIEEKENIFISGVNTPEELVSLERLRVPSSCSLIIARNIQDRYNYPPKNYVD